VEAGYLNSRSLVIDKFFKNEQKCLEKKYIRVYIVKGHFVQKNWLVYYL